MITITFMTHATSVDNERKIASGFADAPLSALGKQQATQRRDRYTDQQFAAIFCSDLQRSYMTGEIIFAGRDIPIIRDARLRECDYGDLTQQPTATIEAEKLKRISEPFPHGESFTMTLQRMRSFLVDLAHSHAGKNVVIIGHRATQYGLECLLQGKTLQEVVQEPFTWQAEWLYQYRC